MLVEVSKIFDKSKDFFNNLYIMQEKDISEYSVCLAEAFKDYVLFEYLSGGSYDIEKMTKFWEISIRTSFKSLLGISADEKTSSVILLKENCSDSTSVFEYIKHGGLKFFKLFGIKNTLNIMNFENFAEKIKNKYTTKNCTYLLAFATRPEMCGKGYGSSVMKPVLEYLDKTEQDCYLETLKEYNVALYEHFGFELKETAVVPNTDMKLYAMLRKYNK